MEQIQSKIKNYKYGFVENALGNAKELLANTEFKWDRSFFFIDENFYNLYKGQLDELIGDSPHLIIEAVESNKDYINLGNYFEFLIQNKFTRKDVLVTFGGGILQDISGFIASTLYRGVKWVFFPTTLLAQADSCIGSKTSINFKDSKNLIGSFYPPDLIFIDPYLCKTLTDGYFNSGVGEVIKFHLLADTDAYARLLDYLGEEDTRETPKLMPTMKSTLAIKKSYFEQDEFDTGIRNLLNYGHCFGHALEAATDFEVCHGEAVIVGMGFSNRMAVKRGLMTQQLADELEKIIAPRYPRFTVDKLKVDDILKHMWKDKKRVGPDLTAILLHKVGEAHKHDDVKEDEIKVVFEEMFADYPR